MLHNFPPCNNLDTKLNHTVLRFYNPFCHRSDNGHQYYPIRELMQQIETQKVKKFQLLQDVEFSFLSSSHQSQNCKIYCISTWISVTVSRVNTIAFGIYYRII